MSFVHPTHTLTPTNNSSEYVIEEPESVEPTMHINDIIYPSFKDVNGGTFIDAAPCRFVYLLLCLSQLLP